MNCEYHKKSIGGFTIKEKFFLLGHFNIQVQIAENNSMKIDKKRSYARYHNNKTEFSGKLFFGFPR